MRTALEKLGFDVILRTNANRGQIKQAVRTFESKISRGGVGLFYYAGHGVQVDGTNYIIPVGVDIKKKYDIEEEALKMRYVLGAMEEANNHLNIIILDACRDNPFRGFRSSSSGLARMDVPTGSIIAYATAPGKKAADGVGRNGTYTAKLLKNLTTPNLSVQEMLNQTGLDVMADTNRKQIPWVSSTPVAKYYLIKGSEKPEPLLQTSVAMPESDDPSFDDLMNTAQKKKEQEAEWAKWQAKRKEVFDKVKQIDGNKYLDKDQKKAAWERLLKAVDTDNPFSTEDNQMRTYAMGRIDFWEKIKPKKKKKSIVVKDPECVQRNDRFCKIGSGPVLDKNTGLMWASTDNGRNINWKDAKRYCETYSEGGFTNWRMPTIDELEALYDKTKGYESRDHRATAHITQLIRLTIPWLWASNTSGSEAALFNFRLGTRLWDVQFDSFLWRVLPVRDSK